MRTHGRMPNPPGGNDGRGTSTKIELDAESAEKFQELSYKTRLPIAELTRRIMNEALARVGLIPAAVWLYNGIRLNDRKGKAKRIRTGIMIVPRSKTWRDYFISRELNIRTSQNGRG